MADKIATFAPEGSISLVEIGLSFEQSLAVRTRKWLYFMPKSDSVLFIASYTIQGARYFYKVLGV